METFYFKEILSLIKIVTRCIIEEKFILISFTKFNFKDERLRDIEITFMLQDMKGNITSHVIMFYSFIVNVKTIHFCVRKSRT